MWLLGFIWWGTLFVKKLENARLISIAIDNGSIVQLGNLMSCKMFHCSIMICFFFNLLALGFVWWGTLLWRSGKILFWFSLDIDNGTVDQLGMSMTCRMLCWSITIVYRLHDVRFCKQGFSNLWALGFVWWVTSLWSSGKMLVWLSIDN